jgi:hypothetical protein
MRLMTLILMALAVSGGALAQTPECRTIAEPATRLACYDKATPPAPCRRNGTEAGHCPEVAGRLREVHGLAECRGCHGDGTDERNLSRLLSDATASA